MLGGAEPGLPPTARPDWTASTQPYTKNVQLYVCPTTDRAVWLAGCWPTGQWTVFKTGYGVNELILNDCCGATRMARCKHPAEWNIIADCQNSMIPWHCTGGCAWVQPHVAFPSGGWSGGQLQSNPGADYSDLTAHNGGSNLGFVDGHVKWFNYRNIHRRGRGGNYIRAHPREDGW